MKNFSLVLSGGSVKGFAHIGVIKVLEEYNLKPSLIVGTSMGAIVGAMYALGFTSTQMEEIALKMTRKKIQDLEVMMLFKESILQGKKVKKILYEIFKETEAEDTKIPFIAVASSLDTGKEYWLNSGKLYNNVLASMAVPAIFPAVKINGINMCDGGVSNNLPEDVAYEKYPKNPILSIDVLADYRSQIVSLRIKMLAKVLNAISLLQTNMTALKKNYSTVRIEIPQKDLKLTDFNKDFALKSIKKGERYMRKNIDKFIETLKEEND